jgi:hypothetical protein
MTSVLVRGLLPAGLVAILLTVGYFALTDGWSRLATPVPGLVAVGAGLIGFGIGEIGRAVAGRASGD